MLGFIDHELPCGAFEPEDREFSRDERSPRLKLEMGEIFEIDGLCLAQLDPRGFTLFSPN